MAESISVSSSIATRYATALFELALEENRIEVLFEEIEKIRELLEEGDAFKVLIISPIYSRDDVANAVDAIAERIGLGRLMKNTLALMASKRRLFALPIMLDKLEAMLDKYQGIVSAEIVTAHELSEDEIITLKETLREASGQDVRFNVRVDKSLIGGISARLGSRLVDATVRTKLENLKNSLREVE